jgi:uncharacterized protein with HEPN domain
MRPWLSFRDSSRSLRDILDAIAMIERFAEAMSFEAFRDDPKTIAAIERKLLIISEAAVRLGDEATVLCPDQPWHKIRGTGNWIRHQYERIDLESIWGTVQHDLPLLKAAIQSALILPTWRRRLCSPSTNPFGPKVLPMS